MLTLAIWRFFRYLGARWHLPFVILDKPECLNETDWFIAFPGERKKYVKWHIIWCTNLNENFQLLLLFCMCKGKGGGVNSVWRMRVEATLMQIYACRILRFRNLLLSLTVLFLSFLEETCQNCHLAARVNGNIFQTEL